MTKNEDVRTENIDNDVIFNTTIYYTEGSPETNSLSLNKYDNLYIYKNKYYKEKYRSDSELIDSNFAIYINNLGNDAVGATNTRLFSIVNDNDKTTDNKINNAFTITANGNIYIGGTINSNLSNLKEQVSIEDGKILSKSWMEQVE
jgi:hypothetical protein